MSLKENLSEVRNKINKYTGMTVRYNSDTSTCT